jgi:glutathione S-transferase
LYQLFIANKNYSSWSLRPWVLLKQLGIPFTERPQPFESQDNFDAFRAFSPNGRVPCLLDGETVVWDSLAIIEYLAEHYAGVWPKDLAARTFARCATAEMHSGFSELRNRCPMICSMTVEMQSISSALQRDIDRIDEIWCEGLSQFGGDYLAGDDFTAVDAFFCPVAYRVQGYQLPVSDQSRAYAERLLKLDSMKAWDDEAIRESWREQSHEDDARAAGRLVVDRRI